MLLGIIISHSELSMAVAGIGLTVYLLLTIKDRKILFWSALSVISIVFTGILFKIHLLMNLFGSHRVELWNIALVKFRNNPIFGQGLGIVKTWELKIPGLTTKWLSLHNDWLELAVQLGIVGIILILLVVINGIKKFNYSDKSNFAYLASFISFLVLMMGSFPLEVAPLALFGLVNWWGVEVL